MFTYNSCRAILCVHELCAQVHHVITVIIKSFTVLSDEEVSVQLVVIFLYEHT